MRLLGFISLAVVPGYSIDEIGLGDLENRVSGMFPESLRDEGVFVIADALADNLLRDVSVGIVNCASKTSSFGSEILTTSNLDSSQRSTIASSVNEEVSGCDLVTNGKIAEYRARIQMIGVAVARLLDTHPASNASTRSGEDHDSIIKLVSDTNSGSLDHFHVYKPSEGTETKEPTALSVPFHYDMGFFIILTPEMWVDAKSASLSKLSSLLVKKSDGSIIRVEVKDGKSVIVMIGAGLTSWWSPKAPFKACLHGVEQIDRSKGANRVVLGRMFLPPLSAVSSQRVTFHDFFHAPSRSPIPVSSAGAEWRRLLDVRCAAGKKYCWMTCMDEPDCGGDESVCMNSETSVECGPSECNTKCGLMCPVPNVFSSQTGQFQSYGKNALFCQGATSMVMSGFESVTDSDSNCIILFFRPWLLDSPIKFFFGCLGVFLLGMAIEATIKLRRFVTSGAVRSERVWVKNAAVTSLFGTNVALGYLAMLAAMTFNVEIFFSTVLGLATGHLVFANSKQPVRETADPCCVTAENAPDASSNPRKSASPCCRNLDT